MHEALLFLAPAFTLGLLLVGIHSYLGLHVMKREVIFIDISLSQIAVFGSIVALFFVDEHNEPVQIAFSLLFSVAAALMLSWLRQREKKIPQEAIIGVTYAAASGLSILALDRLPHGAEHLREALVGNILFVTWDQILVTAFVYGAVALFHWIYRKEFWETSAGTRSSFFWDFFFYLLFGIVITFSTKHAGVLVVFSILVIPAALGIRLFQSMKRQLQGAWALGALATTASFAISYLMDFPAGPTIVTVLAGMFFLTLFFA